ncbi:MAG: hypothetical protein ABWY93_18505 [Mycobacterium sp.]
MAFALKLDDSSGVGTEFSDDDMYQFLPDGVLKVTEGRKVTYYGPGFWQLIQTLDDHRPGHTKGRGGSRRSLRG